MEIEEALQFALGQVRHDQVIHPELGLHERVLAYELYHQLRLLEVEGCLQFEHARLQGELNKRAQDYFPEGQPQPDLLFHEPGSNEHNRAVIEIKPATHRTREDRVVRDLDKLALFQTVEDLFYDSAILVLAGRDEDEVADWGARIDKMAAEKGPEIAIIAHSLARSETQVTHVHWPERDGL